MLLTSMSYPMMKMKEGLEELVQKLIESEKIVERQTLSTALLRDFEIQQAIGSGNFGTVKLCKHKVMMKTYCVKILDKQTIRKSRQEGHLKNEVEVLSSISQPFIAQLYNVFQDEESIYLLMDYVCGGEMLTLIRTSGHLSEPLTQFYAAEVVCALEYLHSRRIAHRDLKPVCFPRK